MKHGFHSLLTAVMLILAGTLSPSNGVDDRSNKTPAEQITSVIIIVAVTFTVYVIWAFAGKHNTNSNDEKTN